MTAKVISLTNGNLENPMKHSHWRQASKTSLVFGIVNVTLRFAQHYSLPPPHQKKCEQSNWVLINVMFYILSDAQVQKGKM